MKHTRQTRRKRILIAVVVVAVLAAAAVGGSLYFKSFMTGIYDPVPVPSAAGSRKTVLCLGDSLTHGNVSANYVEILDRAFQGESIRFVNGGINGNMVHDVAARLDALLTETGNPDVVTLLIGTNDANATLDSKVAQRAMDHPDVGRVPDADFYRAGLEDLIRRITGETGAEFILVSIPPIGENPDSLEWKRSREFALAGKEIASTTGVSYVPFNEELSALIAADPPSPEGLPAHDDWYGGMVKALINRHFFDKEYRDIGEKYGYRYHSDQLHLNEEGAEVLVDLLAPRIRLALDR